MIGLILGVYRLGVLAAVSLFLYLLALAFTGV